MRRRTKAKTVIHGQIPAMFTKRALHKAAAHRISGEVSDTGLAISWLLTNRLLRLLYKRYRTSLVNISSEHGDRGTIDCFIMSIEQYNGVLLCSFNDDHVVLCHLTTCLTIPYADPTIFEKLANHIRDFHKGQGRLWGNE